MKYASIEIPYETWYYPAFFALAFLVSFIILVAEGRRRHLPQLPWLIVIASGFVSFVCGCRMITFSINDWNTVLSNQPIDHSTGLVMLGGLLFCVPVILLTKRLVNLNESVLDAYAFVLPIGICLQRIGCFLNGCCFGSVTSGVGIKYSPGTAAFYDHYAGNLIHDESMTSLTVHPVQLYEALGCIIAVLLILKSRQKFKAPGALFYLTGLYYYIVRFITEFFRDPDAYAIHVSKWYGLNTIQWIMIPLIIGSIIILYVKEISIAIATPRSITMRSGHEFKIKYIACFFALALVFLVVSKWLLPIEILVVNLVLFTTAGYLVAELFKVITIPGFRIASLSLILLSFMLMSQTYPEQSISDSTRISYNTISVGGLWGSQSLTMPSSCATTPETYDHKYQMLGLGFSRTVQTGKERSYTLGLSTYFGTHDESSSGEFEGDRPELTTYGITPYVQADFRHIGFGAGVHAGDMSFISTDPGITSIKRYSVYPQLYLRFGRVDRFFGEVSWARNFPTSFPGTYFQTNLGFPLKKRTLNSGAFRIGTSTSTGLFFAASIPIGQNLVMEPYLGFLESPIMLAEDYESTSGTIGSLSFHYKFARRNIPK